MVCMGWVYGAIKSAHGLGMHMKSATESPSDTDTWPRGKHKLRPKVPPNTHILLPPPTL